MTGAGRRNDRGRGRDDGGVAGMTGGGGIPGRDTSVLTTSARPFHHRARVQAGD